MYTAPLARRRLGLNEDNVMITQCVIRYDTVNKQYKKQTNNKYRMVVGTL